MMKTKLAMFILLLVSQIELFGQVLSGNQFSKMVIQSIDGFSDKFSSSTHYLSMEGLPYDFPYDSLDMIPFNMVALASNPQALLNELKKHEISVLEIRIELNENNIAVFVSRSLVFMPKRRHFTISRGEDFVCFVFQYSCETSKWILME